MGSRSATPIRTVIAVLLIGYPLLLGIPGLLRAWPFVDDVPLLAQPVDDWESYKLYAHSILRDGLGIPAVQGLYGSQALAGVPRAFFYNYFLAGLFFVFGERFSPRTCSRRPTSAPFTGRVGAPCPSPCPS